VSRHAHRARRPARDGDRPALTRAVQPVLGALVVLALVVTVVATVRASSGDPGRPAEAGDLAGSTASGSPSEVRTSNARPRTGPEVAYAQRKAAAASAAVATAAQARVQARERAEAQAAKARAAALARKVAAAAKAKEAKEAREARKASEPATTAPFDVVVGTFNVLGSQHTAPGGDRQRFPPASVRSPKAAALMLKHNVDIIGTQELQADQLQSITSRTGLAAWPGLAWGSAETDNSVLYNPDRFELVSGSKFIIPFMGRPRPQPILRLREKATGGELYVVNTHPSAHDGRYLTERRRGQATLVSIVNQLKSTGLPVLVTGDMNDREEFYCRVVPPAGLTAANGGSYADGCHPPPSPTPVDWVVGSGVTWSGYWRDTSSTTSRISDHIMVSATAHVG
jgi:hypothetical protein